MLKNLIDFRRKDLPQTTQRRGGMLNILLIGVWAVTLFTLVMLTVTGVFGIMQQPPILYVMAAVILILITGLYRLNQAGKVSLASILFLTLLIIATTLADDPREVLAGRTLLFFSLPILMASFVLPVYASFVTAILIILMHSIMWLSLDNVPYSPFGIVAFMVMSLIAWLAASTLEQALDQAYKVNLHLDELVGERTKELAEANAYLESANEQLQELDALKSKFVSDVSHELRTPISNISIYLEMLEGILSGFGEKLPGKTLEFLKILRSETERLTKLITDVLSTSRLEQAMANIEMQIVDVNPIIRDVVEANRLKAESKEISLSLSETNATPKLLAEPDQLKQVFTNLVANAVNYTPKGSIHVSTKVNDQNQFVFQIQDTGMGIASEDLEHLFERFYRGKQASRSSIPGTGLGLSITKEIVEAHQGTIEIESELNVGTTFTITLPIHSE